MIETAANRILLVEDNTADARLITEYLNEQAESDRNDTPVIQHVERLAEAVDARNDDIDGILLDLGLPDSQKFETLETMLEASGDEPIVVLTGLDDDRVGIEAVERGAQDYLVKGDLTPKLLRKTLRYAIERERQQQEMEQADTLFQNAQDGLFVVDVEDGGETFRINQVNRAYEALTGASSGELRGKTVREIADDVDTASIRERYGKCVDSQQPLQYEEYLSAFDSGSWWETRIQPVLTDGVVTQIVGSTRNITDRMGRVNTLRKFEQMVQHTGHAVFFTDVNGVIEFVNPAFEELTGYASAEMLGETPQLLNSGEHDDDHYAELWETVLAGNVWSGEIVNERKDGTQFVASHTIAPVTDDSGDVTHFVAIYDDITERKERERRLQTHELVVQAMNEVAFLIDEEQRIRFVNDAALGFADLPREAIEGRPIGLVTEAMAAPDEDHQRFLDAVDAILNDVDPEVGEWVREPDGSETLSLEFDLYLESVGEVHAEQRFVPVEFYDGERGVAVISRDVTTRKEKEKEIQTHLEQAQEVGTVGSWQLDLVEETLHWSDECYRIFGIQSDQPMTYERFMESVHPEDREKLDDTWSAALEGDPYDIEHRIVVDGEVKWVQETAEITFNDDGEPIQGTGVVKDITEQVEREREISEQKRQYESLFNSVSGAVVVTDLDGCITTCNPGFTDLFGYETDDITGEHLSTITVDSTAVWRLLEETDGLEDSQLVNYRKNFGQVFPGESRCSPLRTHGDEIEGYVIHVVDVSDAEENREQLQVLSRVLRHNVRNGMNTIMGEAELIAEEGSETVTPRGQRILERSREFVEIAENQYRITELLTGSAQPVDMDLVPATRQVISDLEMRYPNATLQTDLADGCNASTTHEITEAIQELVQNALIHSDQEHPRVDVRLGCADGMTELTVRDGGPGIPEQEWKVLTEDGEIDPLNHGTGLGLWFVNQVVRRSSGTLSFDTNDAGGTTVTVRLPASEIQR